MLVYVPRLYFALEGPRTIVWDSSDDPRCWCPDVTNCDCYRYLDALEWWGS